MHKWCHNGRDQIDNVSTYRDQINNFLHTRTKLRIGTYLIFFIMLVDFQMLILLAQSLLSFVYLISDEEDTASENLLA